MSDALETAEKYLGYAIHTASSANALTGILAALIAIAQELRRQREDKDRGRDIQKQRPSGYDWQMSQFDRDF